MNRNELEAEAAEQQCGNREAPLKGRVSSLGGKVCAKSCAKAGKDVVKKRREHV